MAVTSAALLLSSSHAPRTKLLAKHLGLEAEVATVPTHGPRLSYRLREVAGVTAYLLGFYR